MFKTVAEFEQANANVRFFQACFQSCLAQRDFFGAIDALAGLQEWTFHTYKETAQLERAVRWAQA